MAQRDLTKTVFGDVQALPLDIYRVETESSTYTISIHEERGRKYALVRGASGTDREHVVVRDSDPRIGDRSLFEVHYTEWVGHPLDVATMRTSPITSALRIVIAAGQPVAAPDHALRPAPPPGVSANPRIVPVPARGTAIADQLPPLPPPSDRLPPLTALPSAPHPYPAPRELAHQVVAPDHPAALPYPQRHVRYAEDIATLLRSIHRRTSLFSDVAHDRALRERLHNALDAADKLLGEIRKRM